ncbi:hypothetical protein [Streptomyces fumanus]|uniref:DUF8175 domain-containing protein n=1 Tax=Streptomyces fumanus TaxID=67302 RepID=A0A919E248_9ACTN|nr:hypothetical protein [Streptomyces fumanus]GHF02554.1 hypothetical protein GCM10018772_29010 [Streptomyces fumanus]
MSLGDEHTGQTRTRYPDGDGTPRRPSRSPSRSLITVVGVVVLLIAAIAFANRGDDDSPTTTGTTDKPETSATAPTGERPSGSGFAHDEQGAQSAAANYAVTLVSADIVKPDRRAEIVRQVFVPEKQAALKDRFDKAYSKAFLSSIGLDEKGDATGGNTYVSRTTPIGTKVTDSSGTTTTVEVWCTGVFGTAGEKSTNPVSSDWFTMTLGMRWTDGDWKVESFSQKEGPAPVPGDNKASSADEMSKAVQEYGGFSYAR